jgi:histidinol-phosphate aminotransferase
MPRTMFTTRRSFIRALGLSGVGAAALPHVDVFAARGREALAGADPAATAPFAVTPKALRLNSNENPLGPGEKVLGAIRAAFDEANRYPYNMEKEVQAAVARAHGVKEDHVLVGCGSGEILRIAVLGYTSADRALVAGLPTFEAPAAQARAAGSALIEVPVDQTLALDLQPMADQASGAGLVFLCNPNNPTGTVHGATAIQDFISSVGRRSPRTIILIDEAYHEYVEDPSYRTAIPIAKENPRVIVSRTFSKVYGMAGLRVGYAIGQPDTLAPLRAFKWNAGVNVLASAAAMAALADTGRVALERARNRDVRRVTVDAIRRLGYDVGESHANFVMIDLRRDVQPVIDACAKQDLLIGRAFPPLTRMARLSIGTSDEMKRALDVLGGVLRTGTGH